MKYIYQMFLGENFFFFCTDNTYAQITKEMDFVLVMFVSNTNLSMSSSTGDFQSQNEIFTGTHQVQVRDFILLWALSMN